MARNCARPVETEAPEIVREDVEHTRDAALRLDQRVRVPTSDRDERAVAHVHLRRRDTEAEAAARAPAGRLPQRPHGVDMSRGKAHRRALRAKRAVVEVPRLLEAAAATSEVAA